MLKLAEPQAARPILEGTAKSASYFSRRVLGFIPWAKQTEMLKSVRDHRRTLVISGHAVGKTRGLAALICEWMATKPGARVVCTSSTNRQVHDVLWAEVKGLYHGARVDLGGRLLEREWVIRPDWHAVAMSVDDPTAAQGIHGRHVLVVIDEGEGVERGMVEALESLMASEGARMVVCFNPRTPSGWCHEAAQRPDLWNVLHISCLEHPNVVSGEEVIPGAVTRQWVEEVRQREGEDSDYWKVRVLGQFPSGGTKQLITIGDLEASVDGGCAVAEEPRAGLDVARFGGDRNVCVVFDAHRRMVACESWTGEDLMATTGRGLNIAKKYGARLRVDSCGMGAGVVDRLREQGVTVEAVDFGEAPRGDWKRTVARDTAFRNRRAELHWVTRTLLREKAISIPAKFREVWADLVVAEYGYDSAGRITIEDKESIRKRTHRSPDFADAVHIAMSGTRRGRF